MTSFHILLGVFPYKYIFGFHCSTQTQQILSKNTFDGFQWQISSFWRQQDDHEAKLLSLSTTQLALSLTIISASRRSQVKQLKAKKTKPEKKRVTTPSTTVSREEHRRN
ncbi:unnamed protein product [Eruca vesicaria subsp. sativa]|uniref:Uncharacterized protein n=1 Tax=Eruca vesicaria subsp. sativa TaxID=29727 RepID=A0ABC8KL38_ERUVS|nr:unnamed protein product [Eruca vesicaria subsp. sativa]